MTATDDHYTKYLWARWRRLGRSGSAWIALTALVALLSTTPSDFGSLPDWKILATIPATGVLVLFCIAPIIYLRAKTLHQPTPPVSPAAPSTRTYLSLITRTISFPHASRITTWYLFASLVSTFVFINLWTTRHESHEGTTLDLGFWKPTARHPWHLNERVLFLYLGNALFALFIAHKGIFDGAWGKEQWPVDNASLAQRLTARVTTTALHQLPLYTLLFTITYPTLFWLLRRPIASLLIRHSFGFFRPFIAQIARNKSLVGWGLVGRLAALAYATGVLVRLPGIVFDISATQRLDFSPLAKGRKADSYIISALQSSDDYYLTFTALEVADRSHQATNRKLVFDDLSTKPTAWQSLYQGCIAQLGKSYARLATRGGRLSPSSASASSGPPREPVTSIPTAQMRQVQSVFYVPPQATKPAALVDQVKATDAKLAQVATAGISYIRQRAPTRETVVHAGEKALEWISPLEARVPQVGTVVKSLTDGAETARQGVEKVQQSLVATSDAVGSGIQSVATQVRKPADEEWRKKGLYPRLGRYADKAAPPGTFRRWLIEWFMGRLDAAFARRWARDEIEFVLPRRRIDADLLRTLAAYVAASLHEDTYGQVQNCVPEIMEMFYKYYAELAAYKREFREKAEGRGKQAWVVEADRAWAEEVAVLSQVIQQAVRNVQQVFGEHMKAFEISPAVLQGLKSITQEA